MRIPLSSNFTAFSIILFIISLFLTMFERIPLKYGFLLIVVSVIFIVSSVVSVLPDEE